MSKKSLLSTPTRVSDMTWDKFYDDMSSDWQEKAERLQVRRWKKLKREMRDLA